MQYKQKAEKSILLMMIVDEQNKKNNANKNSDNTCLCYES